MLIKEPSFGVIALICLLNAHTAFAADIRGQNNSNIEFEVPIDIKNYVGLSAELQVGCELRSAQGQVISFNSTHFPIQSGQFTGSQQVKVPYDTSDVVNIKAYRCAIFVSQQKVGGGGGFERTIPANATILSQINGSFN